MNLTVFVSSLISNLRTKLFIIFALFWFARPCFNGLYRSGFLIISSIFFRRASFRTASFLHNFSMSFWQEGFISMLYILLFYIFKYIRNRLELYRFFFFSFFQLFP